MRCERCCRAVAACVCAGVALQELTHPALDPHVHPGEVRLFTTDSARAVVTTSRAVTDSYTTGLSWWREPPRFWRVLPS
jgi:hypothetical protein